MLYLFGGKVYLMKGTEKVKEVQKFTDNIKGIEAEDYLTYLFFTYHKQKSPFITLPIQQRRDFVITHYKLFDFESHLDSQESLADKIESNSYFSLLKEYFINLNYTSLERQLMAIESKIEQYQYRLSDPMNSPALDIELNKALTIFRNTKIEIEGLIAMESQDDTADGRLHLFEVPEDHVEQINGIFV